MSCNNVNKRNEKTDISMESTTTQQNQNDCGEWEVLHYNNEFGEPTDNKYLLITGEGMFSNTVADNEPFEAWLYFEEGEIKMKLVNYKNSVLKEPMEFDTKIRNSKGDIIRTKLFHYDSGIEIHKNDSIYRHLIEAFQMGGELAFSAHKNHFKSDYQCHFKMNVSGFENARKKLNSE